MPAGDSRTDVLTRMRRSLAQTSSNVSAPATSLIRLPGKLLRAQMLAAAAEEVTDSRVGRLAAAIELVHTGSLLHDDIVDRADLRRGAPAAVRSHGSEAAAESGIACLALAADELSLFPESFGKELARALTELVEGEMRDVESVFRTTLTRDWVLKTAALKTGSLFGAACAMGGRLWADDSAVGVLRAFGVRFGTVFQILDDCRPYTSRAPDKSVDSDLRYGTMTVPLVLALDADPSVRSRLEDALRAREWSADRADDVRELVRDSGGIDRARALAEAMQGENQSSLSPRVPGARGLLSFTESAYTDLWGDLA